jgi:hypothetical protein
VRAAAAGPTGRGHAVSGATLTHFKASPGKAFCDEVEPDRSPALPGEWLLTEWAEVDCPICLEWRHA